LPRNVDEELTLHATQRPRRVEISSTSLQKPEITPNAKNSSYLLFCKVSVYE